jgi:hypothetical protein
MREDVYRSAQGQVEGGADRGDDGLHPHDRADPLLDEVTTVLGQDLQLRLCRVAGVIAGRSSRARRCICLAFVAGCWRDMGEQATSSDEGPVLSTAQRMLRLGGRSA